MTLEPRERCADGPANIEARAVAAEMTVTLPAHVARQLVDGIKFATLDETLCQAERHRGVIGPFAWSEVERAATVHVVDGIECSWRAKLERRPQRVARSQAKQSTTVTVEQVHASRVTCRSGTGHSSLPTGRARCQETSPRSHRQAQSHTRSLQGRQT